MHKSHTVGGIKPLGKDEMDRRALPISSVAITGAAHLSVFLLNI